MEIPGAEWQVASREQRDSAVHSSTKNYDKRLQTVSMDRGASALCNIVSSSSSLVVSGTRCLLSCFPNTHKYLLLNTYIKYLPLLTS